MRDGEVTEERLLDEALKLVLQKGSGATSVNDLHFGKLLRLHN